MLTDDQLKSVLGLTAVPAVLALALLTSGCNTMRGMGEDVEAAGSAMSGTAESTEEKIEGEMSDDDEAAGQTEEEMMDEGTTGDQTQ